jgi:hypothetical protein
VYRSIFSPATAQQRAANFESYWEYLKHRSGELDERERSLSTKKERLERILSRRVLSRTPLSEDIFRRNCIRVVDDPATIPRKELLLANMYRFANHEAAAINPAWEATVPLSKARSITDKISRYHAAEEISHGILFREIFRTFHVEVDWAPVDEATQRAYRAFARAPGILLNQPAFLCELLGMVFYRFIDSLLDDCLVDEPQARESVRDLFYEIMSDEACHIGNRRNFLGPLGIRSARLLLPRMCGWQFGDMPDNLPSGSYRLDRGQMVEQSLSFAYNGLPSRVMECAWVPSYCQV